MSTDFNFFVLFRFKSLFGCACVGGLGTGTVRVSDSQGETPEGAGRDVRRGDTGVKVW